MRRISSTGLTMLLPLLALSFLPAGVGRLQAWSKEEQRVEDFLYRPSRESPANADDLTKLLFDRYKAAHLEVRLMLQTLGEPSLRYNAQFSDAVNRMVDAELEVVTKREERLAILEGHARFLKEAWRVTKDRYERGARGVTLTDAARARYYQFDAEIRLLKAKREKDATARP